jgi:antitoxin (DNA-binding transcriptional repressor) of toxin-antitoxin stability system
MKRVRAGAETVIENGGRPLAVLQSTAPARRSISDCIALVKAHEEETGKAPVFDADFAEDMEEILSHRKPWNASVGIILDSSIIIAAERRGHTVREILEQIKAVKGEVPSDSGSCCCLSVAGLLAIHHTATRFQRIEPFIPR